MEAVVRSERRRVLRVPPDAWRDPEVALNHEDVLQLGMCTATSSSPARLVPAALRCLLPEDRVRSWAVITIDEDGGLHRGANHPADPGLYARAVAWLWTATGDSDSADGGAVYVETWPSESGAEAVTCIPLVYDGVVTCLIAIWLIGDDADALLRDASCLTIIRSLCANIELRDERPLSGETGSNGGAPEALTVRQTVILQAMARGMTNAQIARDISFSESTVRLESMSIYRYFGVHSRIDAVQAAREAGVL